MRAGRYSIIVGLLVLVASLAMGSHHHVPSSAAQALSRFSYSETTALHTIRHYQLQTGHAIAVIVQGESSGQNKHKERRHGKSLVSEAIVAESPIGILPRFTYCHRNYSLFLPGGCTRQFTGNFSLRGPPVC